MKANYKITMPALAGIALGTLTIIVSGHAALAQDTVRVRGTDVRLPLQIATLEARTQPHKRLIAQRKA